MLLQQASALNLLHKQHADCAGPSSCSTGFVKCGGSCIDTATYCCTSDNKLGFPCSNDGKSNCLPAGTLCGGKQAASSCCSCHALPAQRPLDRNHCMQHVEGLKLSAAASSQGAAPMDLSSAGAIRSCASTLPPSVAQAITFQVSAAGPTA